MSLNRCEQTVFDYWETHPDEKRHWQTKVSEVARSRATDPSGIARDLERQLWEYFVERTPHVPQFRELASGGRGRISLMNLADYLMWLWGPPPKTIKPTHPAP